MAAAGAAHKRVAAERTGDRQEGRQATPYVAPHWGLDVLLSEGAHRADRATAVWHLWRPLGRLCLLCACLVMHAAPVGARGQGAACVGVRECVVTGPATHLCDSVRCACGPIGGEERSGCYNDTDAAGRCSERCEQQQQQAAAGFWGSFCKVLL